MALLQTLQDTFNDNSIGSEWTLLGSGTPSDQIKNQNGDLEITTKTTSGYWDLISTSSYDLTGSYAYCQIIDRGNQSLASFEVILYVDIDSSNKVYYTMNSNTLDARKIVAGVNVSVASAAYSATNHKWLKIRESGGTIFWDVSTDGITWNNFTSFLNPFAITAVFAALECGTYNNEASTSTGKFDNFNVTPSGIRGYRSLLGVGI